MDARHKGGHDDVVIGMSDTYDGIILGAGHNGLILQAYLGKAGLKTLTLERKAVEAVLREIG